MDGMTALLVKYAIKTPTGDYRLIFLNGKMIQNVTHADPKRGICKVAMTDSEGRLKFHKHKKKIQTRLLRGKVDVRGLSPEAVEKLDKYHRENKQ